MERKAEPSDVHKIGDGQGGRSRVCTFHHAGFVDGKLQASFVDLDMGFVGETYATEEKVELAGRARNSSEEWKVMLCVHLAGLGVCCTSRWIGRGQAQGEVGEQSSKCGSFEGFISFE